MKATKTIKCGNRTCSERRVHHEFPNVKRKHRTIEVPNNYNGRTFCSLECKVYQHGAEKEFPIPPDELDGS